MAFQKEINSIYQHLGYFNQNNTNMKKSCVTIEN